MTTVKNLPRDVFLHLLSIITLVTSAISLGVLIFQYINVYIPDIISDPYFSKSAYLSSMRFSLATLIIVFPVFIWVVRFLKRDINKFPEKRDLKIRKWLLYLTLFAAALVIMGDLVALLRSYLEGELSQRFTLKVLAILFIAGSIFVHYLYELREKELGWKWIKAFDWLVVIVVLVGIVSGFFIAGTPKNQRLVRLDERRISDLQTIQWQIINYWQRKEVLPPTLNELMDPISGFVLPRDPANGGLYEYKAITNLMFELCASFDTTTSAAGDQSLPMMAKPVPVGYGPDYNRLDSVGAWDHQEGRVCFKRDIDPQLYPPLNKELKLN